MGVPRPHAHTCNLIIILLLPVTVHCVCSLGNRRTSGSQRSHSRVWRYLSNDLLLHSLPRAQAPNKVKDDTCWWTATYKEEQQLSSGRSQGSRIRLFKSCTWSPAALVRAGIQYNFHPLIHGTLALIRSPRRRRASFSFPKALTGQRCGDWGTCLSHGDTMYSIQNRANNTITLRWQVITGLVAVTTSEGI